VNEKGFGDTRHIRKNHESPFALPNSTNRSRTAGRSHGRIEIEDPGHYQMLRKILIALHLAGAAISVVLFVSTFVAKGVITSKAQQFALDKSRVASDPLATKLQDTLDHPVIGKLIPDTARERITTELATYQSSPDAWLLSLAEGGADRAKDFDFPEIENAIARKAVDVLADSVSGIKDHMHESYRGLIFDLRLFTSTNVVAFLVAAWLSWIARTPRSRHWLLTFSGLMLIIFAMSINAYRDQNWAWSILTGSYMGWSYPVMLGFAIVYGIVRISPELAQTQPAKDSPEP
jgi:hypothetical protein